MRDHRVEVGLPSRADDAVCQETLRKKLGHNLVTSFQITTTATEKPRTAKRTTLFFLQTIATLRFEWLNKPRGSCGQTVSVSFAS